MITSGGGYVPYSPDVVLIGILFYTSNLYDIPNVNFRIPQGNTKSPQGNTNFKEIRVRIVLVSTNRRAGLAPGVE